MTNCQNMVLLNLSKFNITFSIPPCHAPCRSFTKKFVKLKIQLQNFDLTISFVKTILASKETTLISYSKPYDMGKYQAAQKLI